MKQHIREDNINFNLHFFYICENITILGGVVTYMPVHNNFIIMARYLFFLGGGFLLYLCVVTYM